MRNSLFTLAFCFFATIIVGCSPKLTENTRVEYRDSIHTVIKEHLIRDTVGIEIPVEVEKIVTRDTVSHLENKFARSDAAVVDGLLYHSLESKAQIIYKEVLIPVKDTTTFHGSEHHEMTTITQTEYVNRLKLWQKVCIWAFLPLLLVVCFTYRKQLIPIIQKIIKII